MQNTGTLTNPTEVLIRTESELLPPEHEDSEPLEHRTSMPPEQHQIREPHAYQSDTTSQNIMNKVPEWGTHQP